MRAFHLLVALSATVFFAAGCGSGAAIGPQSGGTSPPTTTAPTTPTTSTTTTVADSIPAVSSARFVGRRFAQAVVGGDAQTACGLMTPALAAWYQRRAAALGLNGGCRYILQVAAHNREKSVALVKVGPFKAEDGYMGVLITVSAPDDPTPNATRAVALWLADHGGQTLVARDGNLASVVEGHNNTPWDQWPPATEQDASATWDVPRPKADCVGPSQRRLTPQPVAHLGGPAVSAPWIDMRSVAVVGSGSSGCLEVSLGAPVRADTTVWVERISGDGTQGVLSQLNFGAKGAYDYFGLRPHPQPFAEKGTTLILYPDQPDLLAHLDELKVCVSSTTTDEPLFGNPVFVGDAYPAHDAPCGVGPVP
jgi:hypothetical protein